MSARPAQIPRREQPALVVDSAGLVRILCDDFLTRSADGVEKRLERGRHGFRDLLGDGAIWRPIDTTRGFALHPMNTNLVGSRFYVAKTIVVRQPTGRLLPQPVVILAEFPPDEHQVVPFAAASAPVAHTAFSFTMYVPSSEQPRPHSRTVCAVRCGEDTAYRGGRHTTHPTVPNILTNNLQNNVQRRT